MRFFFCFFFSSRRRHTRSLRDWSSDVCSSDLAPRGGGGGGGAGGGLFGTGITGGQAALYGLAAAPLAMALMKGEPGVPPQANQATALSPQEQALASQMMTSVQQNQPTPSQAA